MASAASSAGLPEQNLHDMALVGASPPAPLLLQNKIIQDRRLEREGRDRRKEGGGG